MVEEVEVKTCRKKFKTILQYIQSVPHLPMGKWPQNQ